MENDVIEVSLRSLVRTENGVAVFLGNDDKCFVIYVDTFVGQAISCAMEGAKRERPLTHDLMHHMLAGFGVNLERVVINHVEGGTFFARIILRMHNELGMKLLELDARPSDSIVLALQAGREILVARSVFEKVEDMTELLERVRRQQAEERGEKD